MAQNQLTGLELNVDALDPTRAFYRDVAGLQVLAETDARVDLSAPTADSPLVTLHHRPDARARDLREAGLFHLALRYPSRRALAQVLGRLEQYDYPLAGASDHQVSEALYTTDPAGNGVEFYVDRPRDTWRRGPTDEVVMTTRRLDLEELRRAADTDAPAPKAPEDTDLGHVHLEVTDVERSIDFYRDLLGLEVQATRSGAAFLAWDGYHHHLGINAWQGRSDPHHPDSIGLARLTAGVETTSTEKVTDNRSTRGNDGHFRVTDPDGIVWRIRSHDARQ